MGVSIDELCKSLEIIENPEYSPGKTIFSASKVPAEWKNKPAPYDLLAKWHDGYALPSTRAVAPLVCERVHGTKTAIEFGCGYGFRLMFYALNNPSTQFVGVDADERALKITEARLEKLGISNVRLEHKDMLELSVEEWKSDCVLAIDCIPAVPPPGFSGEPHLFPAKCFKYFCRMVDSSNPNAFQGMACYAPLTKQHDVMFKTVAEMAGLHTLNKIPFSYVNEKEHHGNLIFASP